MDLIELEKMMEETKKRTLTFENINYFRSLKGLSPLTYEEKLNLCAQEKYSNRIQRVYISLDNRWVSGFIQVNEVAAYADNIYYH